MPDARRRPLSVTLIGPLYISAGALGVVYHATEFHPRPFPWGLLGMEAVRALAIVAGVCMLRGANWARWLALFWMAAHVGISVLNGWRPVVMHAILLAVIALLLLRRSSSEYFLSH